MAEQGILGFDRDLHVEARSVLAHSPHPQNAFEVAIVLETLGYTDGSARALGSSGLFDLANRVYARCDLYAPSTQADGAGAGGRSANGTTGPSRPPRRAPMPRLLARGLLYSVPWLFALLALVVSRVSFWSTITTIQFTTTVTLALFIALVLAGGFTQAFARRGTFYALQGNYPLLRWVARWALGGAAAVAVVVYGLLYVLLEWVLRAYTPASTRMFVLFGLAITALLLSLAPLYMARAFGSVVAVVGAGTAFLIVAGRVITDGNYINPYTAMHVQLVSIGVVVAAAVVADVFVLRRVARTPHQTVDAARPPRVGAVLRSVGGYAAYGSSFFLLIIVDQLIAGGLWQGEFVYNGRYELAVGVGLLVLVAALTYAIAVNERFPAVVQDALARYPVNQVARLRRELVSFYRRHLAGLLTVGPAAAGTLLFLVYWFAGFPGILSSVAGVRSVIGLFGGALTGYILLSVGAMNSGLLFALARPAVPAVSAATGSLVSLLTGGIVGWLWIREAGAVLGLVTGTCLFAVATTLSAWRAVRVFDTSYYRAF